MENLGDLVAEHQGSLFAFLFRMCGDAALAEELMQETFVRALQAGQRYRPEARVSTWLLSIAANLVRDRWRRQARRGNTMPLVETDLITFETPESALMKEIDHDQVRQALLGLPLEQRSALIMRYYHDLRYDEIAQALACPIGTVRSRIHNGLMRMKQALAAEVSIR